VAQSPTVGLASSTVSKSKSARKVTITRHHCPLITLRLDVSRPTHDGSVKQLIPTTSAEPRIRSLVYRIIELMETHLGDQTIQEDTGDHVREDIRDCSTMRMFADSREPGPLSWSSDISMERSSKRSSQHESLQASSLVKNSRTRGNGIGRCGISGYMMILAACLLIIPAAAVQVEFQNCLSEAYLNGNQLQFDALYVDAVFNTAEPSHNLIITVWGNVTGSGPGVVVDLPPYTNTSYWNSNQTDLGGKIEDEPNPSLADPKLTTLFSKINVLTYEPWNETIDFCSKLINASCPLGPSFFSVNE
jgi:hypothetical protein